VETCAFIARGFERYNRAEVPRLRGASAARAGTRRAAPKRAGVVNVHDSKLFALFVDQTDLGHTDLAVDSELA
jgi:hypothetical protein